MKTIILQLLTAFTGSLGFCLPFRVRKELILAGSLGGMLGWGAYLAAEYFTGDILVASFLAAVFGTTYASWAAVHMKAPVTLFLTPTLIPLVPGRSLYMLMYYVVRRNPEQSAIYGDTTMRYVLGIAGGVSLVAALNELTRKYRRVRKNRSGTLL